VCRVHGTATGVAGLPDSGGYATRLERPDLAVEEIDLAQTAVKGQPLVDWQLQLGQPSLELLHLAVDPPRRAHLAVRLSDRDLDL